jgi:hypothetical protein
MFHWAICIKPGLKYNPSNNSFFVFIGGNPNKLRKKEFRILNLIYVFIRILSKIHKINNQFIYYPG